MKFSIVSIRAFLDKAGLDYRYLGASDLVVEGFCPLTSPRSHHLTWASDLDVFETAACDPSLSVLIVTKYPDGKPVPEGYNFIFCPEPRAAYFSIMAHFVPSRRPTGISSTAVVETSKHGTDLSIGHHCYIGPDVTIGNGVTIHHNVVIDCPAEIGDRTVIYSGVVIGTDGFGYFDSSSKIHAKIPHIGGVKIGQDVEIGANSCIDRGTLGNTIIGDNVKIDNLCQIAHNVQVGNNVFIIGLSGIGGSCVLEDGAYIAPHAILKQKVRVEENGFVGLGAVVLQDVPANSMVAGNPARQFPKSI